MTEAGFVDAPDGGRMPAGEGWFVLNARDARWIDGPLGKYTGFEGEGAAKFPQLGMNVNVMAPGEPMTMYHREGAQEDFLVVAGECVLIVDGQERPLKQWDLFHCPAGVDHAIVGAGTGQSIVVAAGARTGHEEDDLVYPADPVALRHGAAPPVETTNPREAYAPFELRKCGYEDGWLPE